MAASATLSLSLLPNPKPRTTTFHLITTTTSSHTPILAFRSSNLSLSTTTLQPISKPIWKISSSPGNYLLSEANPPETAQEIVSTTSPGVSNIIQFLLFIAFIGLSVLTVGVIYIAVTDFLTKRDREKFEKEEAAKKKRSGAKKGVRGRAKAGGPRGFGQKVQIDDDFDLDI